MSEEAQILIAAFGAIKSLEWLFKYLYAKRRDKKYSEKMTSELQTKFNAMEINLINQVGKGLANLFEEKINQMDKRLSYLERQVSDLQISNASIKNLVDSVKKHFDKQVIKIESQYKIILQAIRNRARK